MNFGYGISFQLFDKGVVELLGTAGLGYVLGELSKGLSSIQSGFLYHYSFVMLLSAVIFVLLFLFNFFGFLNSFFFLLLLSYLLSALNT